MLLASWPPGPPRPHWYAVPLHTTDGFKQQWSCPDRRLRPGPTTARARDPDAGEAHCQAQAAVSLRLAHMQLASPGRGKSRMRANNNGPLN